MSHTCEYESVQDPVGIQHLVEARVVIGHSTATVVYYAAVLESFLTWR